MESYLDILIKSVTAYFTLVVTARIMGRKQISQLTYFDYVVGISIGSIAAAVSIEKNIDTAEGVFCIIIWGVITILISQITLKNIKLRLWIDSEPLVIIDKGQVIYKNMKKAKYNMGDLLMQLRVKDIFYITDVEIAILEPDGKLSVLKKSEKKSVTAEDMGIKKPRAGMMMDLILDGKILSKHLQLIQKDEYWVMQQLKNKNIDNIKDVVYLGIQADENLYIVVK